MTAEQRLAAVLELLRRRVASGDVRACVLRDVEALAKMNDNDMRESAEGGE